MKNSMRNILISLVTTAVMVAIFAFANYTTQMKEEKKIRVGYIYDGDASTPYTENFIKAQKMIEDKYGDRVESVVFYNVKDTNIDSIYEDLVKSNCDLVFATSYGFGESIKKWAKEHPETQFCQATCYDANDGEVLENYHNYMGTIYEGRYVAGIAAGAKLKEMIQKGEVSEDEAVIGYVAAFPYAEVISGYTAFYLGVQSQVNSVTMKVIYTDSWNNYSKEKEAAKRLIQAGCVVISQHSDTIGPAVVCQELSEQYHLIHVGYNGSMIDVAPTTSLISSKINWAPYELQAVDAVLRNKNIENNIKAKTYGNDSWGGFDEGWIEMIGLNEYIAADGTQEMMDEIIEKLRKGQIEVFSGPFTGTNPFDPSDTIDLSTPYKENSKTSAPQFHYVLEQVIEILE